MAKAKKRSDGRYQKGFRYEGKQYIVYGSTQKEAEEKKMAKLQELKEGTAEHDDPTLNQYYEKFTEYRQGNVKGATLRCQAYQFRNCADIQITKSGKTLGQMKLTEIKRDDIKKVQKELEKLNLTSRTVNDYMAHLKCVFKTAVDDEKISKNPCNGIKKIRQTEVPASETKHRALTKEETALFFSASTESYYYNFFRLMIQTGMRIGEVTALKYSDIDNTNNCIHITKTITRTETGDYIVGDSAKTKKGSRDIPMNDTIKAIIQDQKRINMKLNGKIQSVDGLVFKAPSGEILREYQINRELKRITKKAGIEYFTCHAFRSTFATRFIEQRPQDYKVLSEILGHADTKITLNLYTHVMQDTKNKAMDSIEIAM